MNFWKFSLLFYLGGFSYMLLELLWRGRSHYSMFLLGGICFLMLGQLQKTSLPPAVRPVLGAAGITALELATGLLINRDHSVWDYRRMPLQFAGQICLPYSLLWIPVGLVGMLLYRLAEQFLDGRKI